jgi:ABC-type cobalamin/Fe3+-siderophores transport system ATPase subunit
MQSVSLTTKNLTVRRGQRAVLREVNLEFAGGAVTAIIGANGAGKTTLLATLAGLRNLEHGDGEVRLNGSALSGLSKSAIAKQIAFLPAHSHVPFPLSVRELLLLAEPTPTAYDAALEAMELQRLEDKPVTRLSTGEVKRAWIALTLSRRTPLLLLDEPLSGLDPRYQVRLLETLRQRALDGCGVVFIAHDIPYAARADRVVALGNQRIVADGAPLEVLTADLLRELYGVDVWIGTDPLSGAVVPIATRAI